MKSSMARGMMVLAVLIRVVLIWTGVGATLSRRIEVATPLTSIKRLAEGHWLWRVGMSPYAGSAYHSSPLLLPLLGRIAEQSSRRGEHGPHGSSSLLEALPFLLADIASAILLHAIAVRFFRRGEAVFFRRWESMAAGQDERARRRPEEPKQPKLSSSASVSSSSSSSSSELVPMLYLLNPFSIAVGIGSSTSPFDHFFVFLSIYGALRGNAPLATFGWVLASHFSLYHFVLIIPIVCLLMYGPDGPPAKTLKLMLLFSSSREVDVGTKKPIKGGGGEGDVDGGTKKPIEGGGGGGGGEREENQSLHPLHAVNNCSGSPLTPAAGKAFDKSLSSSGGRSTGTREEVQRPAASCSPPFSPLLFSDNSVVAEGAGEAAGAHGDVHSLLEGDAESGKTLSSEVQPAGGEEEGGALSSGGRGRGGDAGDHCPRDPDSRGERGEDRRKVAEGIGHKPSPLSEEGSVGERGEDRRKVAEGSGDKPIPLSEEEEGSARERGEDRRKVAGCCLSEEECGRREGGVISGPDREQKGVQQRVCAKRDESEARSSPPFLTTTTKKSDCHKIGVHVSLSRVILDTLTWTALWWACVLSLCDVVLRWRGPRASPMPAAAAAAAAAGGRGMVARLVQMLSETYGFVLAVDDLSPTLGLFWYFFSEMFDFFRTFFLFVFHATIVVLILPTAIRLHHRPVFLAYVYISTAVIMKSYPSLGDAALYLSFLPLFATQLKGMRFLYLIWNVYLYVAVLGPVMYDLWIWRGTGNANFYYANTLAYACVQSLLLVRSVATVLKFDRDFKFRFNKSGNPTVVA